MKTKAYIFMMISLLATMLVGCSGDDDILPDDSQTVMKLYVYMPGQMAGTRAYTGDVAADKDNESIIKSLEVWVFDSGNSRLLFHAKDESETGINYSSGVQREFIFTNKDYKDNATEDDAKLKDIKTDHPLVDVYVLVNAASIGHSEIGESTTKDVLDALSMGDSEFGINGSTFVSSPTTDGLPMSGVLKNYTIEEAGANMFMIQTIHIKRCVSKLRVVVSRSPGMEHAVINSVTLKGGSIPTSESVFNDNEGANAQGESRVTKTGNSYYNSDLTLASQVANSAIAPNTTPLALAWNVTSYDDAQSYETAVNNTISAGKATELARAYLHESSKLLTVTIEYKSKETDTAWKTATVSMDPEATAGEFARNHSWIIYAYFVEGELYVKPTVIPWIAGMDRLTYVTKGSTKMEFEPNTEYLRYDPVSLSSWSDSYACVAYGYTDFGMPLYSPKVILKTEHDYDLQLQLNNIDFEIVVFDVATNTYSHKGDLYTIPANDGNPQTTTIWVVPTSNNMPSDVNASLMLTLLRPEDPYAVPYNHELPGNESHTTIKYRYINADRYTTLMSMDPIEANYEKMIIQ